jgi:hypothetical protein
MVAKRTALGVAKKWSSMNFLLSLAGVRECFFLPVSILEFGVAASMWPFCPPADLLRLWLGVCATAGPFVP